MSKCPDEEQGARPKSDLLEEHEKMWRAADIRRAALAFLVRKKLRNPEGVMLYSDWLSSEEKPEGLDVQANDWPIARRLLMRMVHGNSPGSWEDGDDLFGEDSGTVLSPDEKSCLPSPRYRPEPLATPYQQPPVRRPRTPAPSTVEIAGDELDDLEVFAARRLKYKNKTEADEGSKSYGRCVTREAWESSSRSTRQVETPVKKRRETFSADKFPSYTPSNVQSQIFLQTQSLFPATTGASVPSILREKLSKVVMTGPINTEVMCDIRQDPNVAWNNDQGNSDTQGPTRLLHHISPEKTRQSWRAAGVKSCHKYSRNLSSSKSDVPSGGEILRDGENSHKSSVPPVSVARLSKEAEKPTDDGCVCKTATAKTTETATCANVRSPWEIRKAVRARQLEKSKGADDALRDIGEITLIPVSGDLAECKTPPCSGRGESAQVCPTPSRRLSHSRLGVSSGMIGPNIMAGCRVPNRVPCRAARRSPTQASEAPDAMDERTEGVSPQREAKWPEDLGIGNKVQAGAGEERDLDTDLVSSTSYPPICDDGTTAETILSPKMPSPNPNQQTEIPCDAHCTLAEEVTDDTCSSFSREPNTKPRRKRRRRPRPGRREPPADEALPQPVLDQRNPVMRARQRGLLGRAWDGVKNNVSSFMQKIRSVSCL